ncbi:MAG: ABC transporter permease subunit [Anaerolineae bacterium]|nr:ABC transporter permease subunit [Anaerolineae bacterium]
MTIPSAPRSMPDYTRRSVWTTIFPYLLISPPVILVFFGIFYPATQSFIRTLVGQGEETTGALSLIRYSSFFSSPSSLQNLWFTIQITLISVLGLFVICLPLALYLRFSKSRLSNIVQGVALLPLFVPGIILAYALAQFLGARGTINELVKFSGIKPLLDAAYHFFGATGYRFPYLRPEGIVIGLVWESIPFTVLVLSAGLGQIDDALIESARDAGANALQIFVRIILPLIQRSATIALCLNFIGMFGSYTLPYLLGPAAPQMMGVFMQRTYSDFRAPREAETQAVITFAVCLIVGLFYIRTISRQPNHAR